MLNTNLQPGEIIESLGQFRLKVIQNKNSYCFSVDSLLLAEFIKIKNREKIIDLGTGCGIIPLLLYSPQKNNVIFGVEIQEKLASLAERNILINNLEKRIFIQQ
ncbi:MAG TPA: methyltransferase, partial [Atribacterota bacterium]|nr:methyltransferase [Atribacterota bacterium]